MNFPHPSRSPRLALATALMFAVPVVAQCTPQWAPGDPLTHLRGTVRSALTWDPDGTGPTPLQLIAGGNFVAGTSGVTAVAAFDGTRWTPLGTLVGEVTSLVVWNGQLIAAVSAPAADTICRWNGTAWQVLGETLGHVYALAVFNAEIVVGGDFTSLYDEANFVTAFRIARWNGATWSEVGGGIYGDVRALTVFDNQLLAGGSISHVNVATSAIAVGNLAVWNGSSWLPTATFNGPVETFAIRTSVVFNGDTLFVGGSFTTCGGAAAWHVARYSQSTGAWAGVTGLPGATCRGLFVNNGILFGVELVAIVDSSSSPQVAWRWTGSTWSTLGSLEVGANPACLSFFNGQYLIGLSNHQNALRRFDGTASWPAVRSAGIAEVVRAVDATGDDVVIGGEFATISGVTVNGIARGTYGDWQPLGSGIAPPGVVRAVARMGNGDVIAAGSFGSAGGVAANNIARWNGSTWSPLGAGCNGDVHALRVLANGDVVACGAFTMAGTIAANRVARWNGSTWSAFGSGCNATARAVVQLANGDLVVGGDFVVAGATVANRIARWNGTAWSALGSGFDRPVFALAVLPGGTIAAGGNFLQTGPTAAFFVALWNGSNWVTPTSQAFRPNAEVHTLTVLADGDLVAGGASFYSTSPSIVTNLARWNGTGWSSLDVLGQDVTATTMTPTGELIAVGDFDLAGNRGAGNVAHQVTPCPAQATPYAFGCAGAGGPDVLVAQTLPWTGNTLHEVATGMPNGIAIVVTGFLPTALLLDSVLPPALPGCFLAVWPDWIDAVPVIGGIAHYQLAIADDVALAGVVFYQQVVPFELGPNGDITAITSSNGLVLRVGTF